LCIALIECVFVPIAEIQTLYGQKQKALSGYNENTLVKGVSTGFKRFAHFDDNNQCNCWLQELDILDDTVPVYKLVGPVLMKVELSEASQNVQKRLEFIEKEIEKLDNGIGRFACSTTPRFIARSYHVTIHVDCSQQAKGASGPRG
jgi:chaperonin cofactor prefoldin